MIIDVDHIALCSKRLNEDINFFESLGYEPRFIERNKTNPHIKKKLMKKFSETQDLALLDKSGSLSIELIKHEFFFDDLHSIIPVLENPPREIYLKETNYLHPHFKYSKLVLGHLEFYLDFNEKKNECTFNKLALSSEDIEKSIIFWKAFGFSVYKYEKDFAILIFQTPLRKKSLEIQIERKKKIATFLDTVGFNCIAFITNSSKSEMKHLRENKIDTTEIESFEINGKVFNIFFATGPCGELVEVIGIK